jgi:hypothetical protein
VPTAETEVLQLNQASGTFVEKSGIHDKESADHMLTGN